jgi:outer membrane lipoprotein carrier protein
MKRRQLFGLSFSLLLFTGAPICNVVAQEQTEVQSIVANMQAAYDAVDDFGADFRQEFTNQTLGDTTVSVGEMFFCKPGLMRWDYVNPLRLFVIDGQALWIYEPGGDDGSSGQYYTQELDDSDLPTALRFLMGQGDFTDDFDIELVSSTDEAHTLDLVPRRDEGQYRKLRFVIDAATWRVNETIIYDPVGNTNHFTFTNREENLGLSAADFVFVPPAGARRIEEPMK